MPWSAGIVDQTVVAGPAAAGDDDDQGPPADAKRVVAEAPSLELAEDKKTLPDNYLGAARRWANRGKGDDLEAMVPGWLRQWYKK